MSIKSTFLILPFFFFMCVSSDRNIELPVEPPNEKLDTNEFDSDLAVEIRAITNLQQREIYKKKLKNALNKQFSKGLATGERNMKGSHMFVYFDCFVTMVKHDCELVFNHFKDGDFKDPNIREIIRNQKIKLPQFIQDLNDTNDKWMYEGIYLPIPANTATITTASDTQKKGKPIIPKLVTYFQRWYYIITHKPKGSTPLSIAILQSELLRFFKTHKEKYKNYETFLETFAGHVARSYLLTCSLHHNGISTVSLYGKMYPEKPFHDVLLDLIPSWYMNDEQFACLKLLHAAMTTLRDDMPQYEKYVIRNRWTTVQSSDVDWIVIPYYDARQCNGVDLDQYATNIIPNEIYYTYSRDNAKNINILGV